MKKMRGCFLYPKGGEWPCPHFCHKAWGMSVCQYIRETPKFFGSMKKPIPRGMDFLLLESLWCLPTAKKYKDANPKCKVISIIADTTFLPEKLSIARSFYYWRYLKAVDAFVCESHRISKDAYNYMNYGSFMRPIYMVRPFIFKKYVGKGERIPNTLLFIGNATEEKGSVEAANAMEYLYGDKTGKGRFELFLVGSCCDKIHPMRSSNIVACGKVPSLDKYFDKCMYYLHPSNFDPCPTVVWEAMYAGLIPIITKDVGQSELFDGELAILVLDSNEPKVIADKVREIDALSDKKKQRLRKLCMKLASNYTKDKSLKEFKKVFASVFE